jgi:hypothetical protein
MSEHDSQSAVFAWARAYETRIPELEMLFAVPNAGKRSIGAARYYLEEGLRSGVPDIILPCAKSGYHGLVIEMKDGKNKTTANQDKWLHNFAFYGWKVAVCYSADEAIAVLCEYLNIAS